MGLSSDPEKRARQLENLRGGHARAAQKYGLVKPEADPAAPEPKPDLEVIDYPRDEPKPEPEAAPEPKPAARRRAAKPKRPRPEPRPDPRPEPEPEPERGGFWSGFFG